LTAELEERGSSPALRAALDQAETNLAALRGIAVDLAERAALVQRPFIRRRTTELKQVLNVVQFSSGLLLLRWKDGGESQIRFAPPEDTASVPTKWQAGAEFFARVRGTTSSRHAYMPLPALDLQQISAAGRVSRAGLVDNGLAHPARPGKSDGRRSPSGRPR
jgi:hypothetical protein